MCEVVLQRDGEQPVLQILGVIFGRILRLFDPQGMIVSGAFLSHVELKKHT